MQRRTEPKHQMAADDEASVSELVIGTDGRVHVFGTSREILEALDAIGVRGGSVRARLASAREPRPGPRTDGSRSEATP